MNAAAIVAAARDLIRDGLTVGTAGNISVRADAGMLITPSGVHPERMEPDDVVAVDAAGAAASDSRRPSSEWRFHQAIYAARPDVGAVVHTHSPWATAVSCTRRDLPPFHYMMVGTGDGTIRCAPYAPPASRDLAEGVVGALGARSACLLANHGVVAVGRNLEAAAAMAREVETLAQQHCLAQILGGPDLLSAAQVNDLIDIFKAYGQPDQEKDG